MLALDLGYRLRRWLAGCHFYPRHDGRSARRGPADRGRAIYGRRIRLAEPVRAAVRRGPMSRLRAARRVLAGEEDRGRNPRRGLPPDPPPGDRPSGVSVRCFRLRAGGASRGHGPLAGAAVSPGVSDHRAAAAGLAYSVRYRRDRVPFSMVALTFAA